MRKLTLDEAAKELGIKRESVYKRVRRHTLPSTKEADGQLYVYIDAQNGAKKDGTPQQTDAPPQTELQHSWFEYVAAGSGFVAVLAALTYGLGLLSLWMPIWLTYADRATTAWYAASLVPRTVVAGLGFGSLLGYPILLVLSVLVVVIVGNFLLEDLPSHLSGRWHWNKIGAVVDKLLLPACVALMVWLFNVDARMDWSFQTLLVGQLSWA